MVNASAFEEAIENYLTSLPANLQTHKDTLRDELKKTTPEALLETATTIEKNFSETSRFRSLVTRLNPCISQLQRFSRVIDACIQHQPHITALIWGSLKLVIQLASDFNSFFEKFLRMLQQMLNTLPDYDIYMSLFESDKTLRNGIVAVYKDILGFCSQATGIFTKKSKYVPKAALVVARISWRPFDERFKEILESFEYHASQVENAVNIAWMKKDMENCQEERAEREEGKIFREKAEALFPDKRGPIDKTIKIRALINWLKPSSCFDKHQRTLKDRLSGTGKWALNSVQYQSWITEHTSEEENLLWIKGKPGCGKSFLSSLLIEDIQARNSSPQDPSVAYFYCDHSDPRKITTIGAVTTLLSQLLQANVENQAIIDAFALAMFESSSASAGSTEELWSLLDLVLQNLHGACFVIDGLDECDDYDCAELVQMLSQLSTQSHLLKVIIIGRSGCRGLVNSLSKHPTMEVGVEAIFQDILSYISSRIDKVFELGLEGVDSGSRETIVQRLGKSSNGMFLYARLMLDLLCSSALSPHQRAELFLGTELPEDLEQLYARALMVLRSRVKPERELAKRVFTWIACAQRNMRTSEIQIALAQDEIRGRVKTCDFIQNLTEILPVACAGLAEITPDGTVQFIHLTVKGYIQRNSKDLNHYETSFHRQFFHFKEEGNIRLAVGCLRYITLTLPSGPLSSEKHTKAVLRQVRSDFPLLRYAVTGWLWHIEQVSKLSNNRFPQPYTEDLLRLIPDFLKNRDTVLTWVETLYLHGHGIDVCQPVSTSLHQWLRRKKGKEKEGVLKLIDQLAEDLNYIKQEFHHILLPEPQKIWNGMTDFLPETGLLNNRPSNVQKLIPDHPVEPNGETGFSVSENNSPVIVVSDVSLDNTRLGVATVWAPKLFHSAFGRSSTTHQDFTEMSKGWILLVEKWSVDCVQKEAISVQLHLDAEQLSRQLQASECTSSRSGGEPLFGFPLAFSPDLSKIAALTTIYQLEGCRNAMKGIDHSEPAIALPLAEPPKGFYHDYRFTFSNDNRRIAYQQVLRSGRNVDSHREIGVFELADDGAVHQVYQHTAPVSKYIQFDIVNYQFQAKSLQVAIHPTLPLIGWSTLFMGTYISCFSPKNRWEKSVSQPETIDLRFSPCGRFLHGAQNLPMKGWTHVTFPVYSSSLLLLGDSEDICNKSLLGSNQNALELHSSVESNNRRIGLAPGELLVVTNDAGQPTLYSLQEEHRGGDVSLIRLSQSGALETQSIAQVPARESLKTGGVKIILGESSSDGTKLVFNSQSRSWHSPNAGSLSHMDSSKRFPTIYLREREDHGPWKPLTAENGSGMLVGIKRPLLLDDAEVQEEAQRRRLV